MNLLTRFRDAIAGTINAAGKERTDQFARRDAVTPRDDPKPVGVGGRTTAGAKHVPADEDEIEIFPDFSFGTPVDGEPHLRDVVRPKK